MKGQWILGDFDKETQFREDAMVKADPRIPLLWLSAMRNIADQKAAARAQAAFDYASEIEYHHVGLESDVYAAHPIRVASMCLMVDREPDVDAAVIGLLHNLFEVTEIGFEEITGHFGESVAASIQTLTVDRNLQWDRTYKESYYQAIERRGRSTCLVKVLDKLDNLFLIHLNPDQKIRARYIEEIERWVLPMAAGLDPGICDYLQELLRQKKSHNETVLA